MRGQVGAPREDGRARLACRGGRVVNGLEFRVDAEGAEAGARERQRVAAASHRHVERARITRTGEPPDPFRDERRKWNNVLLAQALLTAVFIGFTGLVATAVLGLLGTDISRHVSYGIFSTMITLLAHSMMMFYLIGKGKAVKDAMAEHQVTGDYYRRIAAARKPVFSIGTLAMAVTMTAAILGASVDTKVLPPIVHAMIAYGAIFCNLAAAKIEIGALLSSSRIVDEVNGLIVS